MAVGFGLGSGRSGVVLLLLAFPSPWIGLAISWWIRSGLGGGVVAASADSLPLPLTIFCSFRLVVVAASPYVRAGVGRHAVHCWC